MSDTIVGLLGLVTIVAVVVTLFKSKTQHVKAGEPIPFCCGRLMEILD